jgi:hypothetical protein
MNTELRVSVISLSDSIRYEWCVDIKGNTENGNIKRSSSNSGFHFLEQINIYSIYEIKQLQVVNLEGKSIRYTCPVKYITTTKSAR